MKHSSAALTRVGRAAAFSWTPEQGEAPTLAEGNVPLIHTAAFPNWNLPTLQAAGLITAVIRCDGSPPEPLTCGPSHGQEVSAHALTLAIHTSGVVFEFFLVLVPN